MTGPSGILVWSEQLPLLQELVGQARALAAPLGWPVAAVVFGQPAELGPAGADQVYAVAAPAGGASAEIVAATLAGLLAQAQPGLVLIGATKLGLEVAPRLAERAHAPYVAWATAVTLDPASPAASVTCLQYSGSAHGTYRCAPGLAIITAAAGALGAAHAGAGAGQMIAWEAAAVTSSVKVISQQAKPANGAQLRDAHVIVDAGQGIKTRDDLQLVQRVATLLEGQVACSRPLAADRDWFGDWLGLSGQKVAPDLCLTVGVSGAIQHIIGIRDSHLIAAINNDENAAIFSQADVGVVADLYAFLPILADRLQARGIRSVGSAASGELAHAN